MPPGEAGRQEDSEGSLYLLPSLACSFIVSRLLESPRTLDSVYVPPQLSPSPGLQGPCPAEEF